MWQTARSTPQVRSAHSCSATTTDSATNGTSDYTNDRATDGTPDCATDGTTSGTADNATDCTSFQFRNVFCEQILANNVPSLVSGRSF